MKSLYGTIINHSPRSLFDVQHIYPNAQTMHNSIREDNVPLYGYVLVYYGEPTDGLYAHNLNTDQIYGAGEISIDYNKTIWQKRPNYQNNGEPYYFSIARLNSVLPYTQEVALKGYKNQVVFQRLNAFPLQGEIGYYYQDFGTDATNYEVIHFDNKAMQTFNENEFTDEVRDEFNKQWPAITPKKIYPNFYTANQDIDNTEIINGDYILISYSDSENETIYVQEYEDNKLIDWTNYSNEDDQLNIDYHHMIFQKQDNKYILSSQNRIKLEQIVDEGVVLLGKTEPEFAYSYAMSTDNSRNLQERIETEIFRTETKMEIARANIAITQSTIKIATDEILINSDNILDQKNQLNVEQDKIQTNVNEIKQYQIDAATELSGINDDVSNVTIKIESINSYLGNLKDNVYSSLLTISNDIQENNNGISNEITNTLIPSFDNIVDKTDEINNLADNLNTFIQTTIESANSKLNDYQIALNDANTKITSAIDNANNAITDLNTNINSLTDSSYNITISNSTIDTSVVALEALTTIDTIKTYTAEITAETVKITEQLNTLSSIGTDLQSISNNALTSIKNLTIVANPTYSDLNTSTIPNDIKLCSDTIETYILNDIQNCFTNKINPYINNISNLITNMNNQLTSLNSIHSTLISLSNDIAKLNKNISKHRETLSDYLINRLAVYNTNIENSKKQSLIYSNEIERLENLNIDLTEKIQAYLQINIAQNELLNTVTDEYALYFGMWNWYGYVFLPSIKTITIEDTINQEGKKQENDLPEELKFYNTNTLEYPTK